MASAAAVPIPERVCARDGLAAEDTCLRCGTFVCTRCRRWQAEKALCVGCRERLGSGASRQARQALLLATVGLVTLLPGLFAAVLGHRELARIRRCESPDSGENHAQVARTLGVLETVVLAGLILLAVVA